MDTYEYTEASTIIENIFDQIINRDKEIALSGGFQKITSADDYGKLFNDLIEQKIHEEELERKKKEELEEKKKEGLTV